MAKLLLTGYFGAGNLGDDAILEGFLEAIRGQGHSCVIMSGKPQDAPRLYGSTAIDRRDLAAFSREVKECDALVFPGGSIFQDVTSTRSVMYYYQLVRKAKSAGKKVIMLGQGIGPLNTMIGRTLGKAAFKAADVLVVRDPDSVQTLSKLGVPNRAKLAADMAFLLPAPDMDTAGEAFEVGGMRGVGIIARPWGKTEEIVKLFSELCNYMMQRRFMPVLIEMDRAEDGPLITQIEKFQGGKIPNLRNLQSAAHFQQRLMRLDGLISMRLHGGILATSVGMAPTMISYDPKVTAFNKLMGLPPALSLGGLTAERIFEQYMSMQADREKQAPALSKKALGLVNEARKNISFMNEVLR